MSSAPIPPPLHSPGLAGGRRKGPKNLPKLPLSAFSPPNTGTSDTFALSPTTSSVVPAGIIDSHLRVSEGIDQYREAVGQLVFEKIKGIVLTADAQSSDDILGLVQGLADLSVRLSRYSYPTDCDRALMCLYSLCRSHSRSIHLRHLNRPLAYLDRVYP